MDLSTAIAAAGADLLADALAALTAVAPIALGVVALFIAFSIALRAFKRAKG